MEVLITILQAITQDADGAGLHLHLLIFGGVVVWATMTFFQRRRQKSMDDDNDVLTQALRHTDKQMDEMKRLLGDHDEQNKRDFDKVIETINKLTESIQKHLKEDAAVVANHEARIVHLENQTKVR